MYAPVFISELHVLVEQREVDDCHILRDRCDFLRREVEANGASHREGVPDVHLAREALDVDVSVAERRVRVHAVRCYHHLVRASLLKQVS